MAEQARAAVDKALAEFLSTKGLAEYLDIPVETIYSWRTRSTGPKAHRVGRHTRYRRSDVEAWLEEQADQPRSA